MSTPNFDFTAAVDAVRLDLLTEGAAPGSSLHSWRCEYPDQYGECDCVSVTARSVVETVLPYLLAQIREGVAVAMQAQKFTCPVHNATDCSPLLNGCNIPNYLVGQMQADSLIARNYGDAK